MARTWLGTRLAAVAAAACLSAIPAALSSPAVAATPPSFGPAAAVVTPGCTHDDDYADAWVDGSGTVHGFYSVAGNESFSCGSPATWRFDGRGTSWSQAKAPVAAHVMAVTGDSTGVYLLYAATDGVHLRKRWSGGAVSDRRLSPLGLGTHIVPTGDVAARSGKWWAVWTENSDPSGFAQTELYQAHTLGTAAGRTRVTDTPAWADSNPRLAIGPAGRLTMVWHRQPTADDSRSQVMKATSGTGPWAVAPFTGSTAFNWLPDVVVTADSTAVTWTRDGSVHYADNAGGAWHTHALGTGDASHLARSAGRTFVGYNDHGYPKLAVRGTGGVWAVGTVAPLQGRWLQTITAYGGKATVLYGDGDRLLARTQS